MSNGIRVLLVDDHALLRESLSEHLRREPDLVVAGMAATADEALDRIIECGPDVVLMDIDMPGLICFDAAKRITALQPEVRIIFLSAFIHDHYIERALQVKASGYLTKGESPETVVAAIREVASGGAYFSEEIRSRIVVGAGGAKLAEPPRTLYSTLTSREHEVLQYIARGMAKKQIAATMGLSIKTVDRHAANLMAKLNIHDRVELARFAIREGIAGL